MGVNVCKFNIIKSLFISLFHVVAVSLCFAEKTIYTQEVLAVVLQQLMDKNPLPTLFMRTVGHL